MFWRESMNNDDILYELFYRGCKCNKIEPDLNVSENAHKSVWKIL